MKKPGKIQEFSGGKAKGEIENNWNLIKGFLKSQDSQQN